MKKLLLSLMLITGVSMMFAQTNWSDDFESYNPGDLIGVAGADWTTWSGAAGGADDSAVSDEEAYSGSNSLKLESFSSTGGPADIVLPFAERYTSGGFTFEMWMYVVEGTGAYFNFQAESTVGVNWAQETVFNSDGSLVVRSNSATPISGTYEQDKWFKVQWLLDLDNNKWEIIVDGQCLGFFENNWNTVASLNIYPTSDNNQSVYFVDDVSWSHDPNGLSDVQFDAGVSGLSLKSRTIAGTELPIAGTIQNNGSEAITSFKVLFDDGVNPLEKEFSGLNLMSGESFDFNFGETYLAQEGTVDVSLSIVEVNGQSDQRDCNDVKNASVSGVVPAQYKKVLVEEATGTWCTWCPRGDVFIRWMTRDYPDYFVPIAVHQGDPMANNHIDYVRQAAPGFGGYPNMLIERKEWFSFGTVADVENRFFDQIVEEVDGYMEIGAKWDESTRQLDVSTAVNFVGGTGGNYSIDIVLLETGINKDSAGYQQTNAYAGGARGPMGGYENLPSPVPAKDMIYNHVSRGSLTGDFSGIALSGYTSGERPVVNYSSKVNSFWDAEKFYLVAVLTNPDGTVNNVEEVTLQEAIDNGFETSTVSAEDVAAVEGALIFPNPANDKTFVEMSLISSAEVTISVINSLGEVVAFRNHGQLEGDFVFPVDLGNMPSGTYHIRLQAGTQYKTTTLNVIH